MLCGLTNKCGRAACGFSNSTIKHIKEIRYFGCKEYPKEIKKNLDD